VGLIERSERTTTKLKKITSKSNWKSNTLEALSGNTQTPKLTSRLLKGRAGVSFWKLCIFNIINLQADFSFF
jgi:hypothetical protein